MSEKKPHTDPHEIELTKRLIAVANHSDSEGLSEQEVDEALGTTHEHEHD